MFLANSKGAVSNITFWNSSWLIFVFSSYFVNSGTKLSSPLISLRIRIMKPWWYTLFSLSFDQSFLIPYLNSESNYFIVFIFRSWNSFISHRIDFNWVGHSSISFLVFYMSCLIELIGSLIGSRAVNCEFSYSMMFGRAILSILDVALSESNLSERAPNFFLL